MRSLSAARMEPLRDTGVLIRDEPTTIAESRKAVAQTVPRMTSGRTRYLKRQKLVFAGAAFLLFLFAYFITKLR